MQRIIRQQKYNDKRNQYDPNLSSREHAIVAVRGRPQNPSHAQDLFWAVLFLLQLLAVILCAMQYGYTLWFAQTAPGHSQFWQIKWQSMSSFSNSIAIANSTAATQRYSATTSFQELGDSSGNMDSSLLSNSTGTVALVNFESSIDYQNVTALLSITGLYACIVSYLTFGFMLILARSMIQIILTFSVGLALAWGMLGLTLDPYGIISMMGFTAVLLTLGYSLYSWCRIPFAAQNLYTAMTALRCTADFTIVGLGCLAVAFAWCVIWGMAFIGIVNSLDNFDWESTGTSGPHVKNRHITLYALLLGSFLWTISVIKNVTRAVVANVVGIWWYSPQNIGRICSPVLRGALWQAVTTSLGSICFGSLIVPPARVLVGLLHCFCYMIGNHERSKCINTQGSSVTSVSYMSDSARIPSSDDTEMVSPADPVAYLCHQICVLHDQLTIRLRSCNRWSFTYIGMCKYQ